MERKEYLAYLSQWIEKQYPPESLADVILSDPPWWFKNYSADAPGQKHNRSRGAAKHYPCMKTEEICKLVPPTKKNAILFLWATWPHLPDAMQVIEAWGFKYVSVAWVWVKQNRRGIGFFMGNGYYTRANSEPCLLAVKGRMPVAAHDVLSLIVAPVQEHSRKPADQFHKIARLYPFQLYPNRLEMFARRAQPGWKLWGNEAPGSIMIHPLAPPQEQSEAPGKSATRGADLSPIEQALIEVIREINGPNPHEKRPATYDAIQAALALRQNASPRPKSTLRYWVGKLKAREEVIQVSPRGGLLVPNTT